MNYKQTCSASGVDASVEVKRNTASLSVLLCVVEGLTIFFFCLSCLEQLAIVLCRVRGLLTFHIAFPKLMIEARDTDGHTRRTGLERVRVVNEPRPQLYSVRRLRGVVVSCSPPTPAS